MLQTPVEPQATLMYTVGKWSHCKLNEQLFRRYVNGPSVFTVDHRNYFCFGFFFMSISVEGFVGKS